MIQNKRDLGGLKTRDGKTVRMGMLVRSANLAQAEEDDLDGIATIIDLRSNGERNEVPDRTCGREYLAMPIFNEINEGISHEEEAEQRAVIPEMDVLYGMLMRRYTDSFRRVLMAVMQRDYSNGAVLWHCSEGKDRCGMTTALILEALDVDRKTILEDYLKTNLVNIPKAEKIREQLLATQGEEMANGAYRAYIADEKYIRAAWNEMGDDYIRDRLGIPEEVIAHFRETVLE